MIKWLRKHTKQVMVALVLVAMFSFVGGSALVSILRPRSNPAFARAFAKGLTGADIVPAQGDAQVMESLGLQWRLGGPDTQHYHWYLLLQEAQKAGIIVTDAEVDKILEALRQRGVDAAYLHSLRLRRQISMPEVRRALSDYLAIHKNADRVYGATFPSEPELRHYVRDTEEKARIRFVALDAQSFVEKDRPSTPEELQAQFDKYKDLDPTEPGNLYGYRHPNRVKVQYILAALPKIQSQIEPTLEEVTAYWKGNKSKYKKVEYVEEPAATTAPATTEPATQPAATRPATQPAKKRVEREKSFSEARKDVERDLRMQKAAKLAEQAMRKANNLLLKPWETAKTDPKTGFKPVPPEVETPDYLRNTCQAISKETGVNLEYGETGLVSKEKLEAWPDLQNVKTAGKGADRLNLGDYAFGVPAFLDKKARHESGSTLQLCQPPDAPLIGESATNYQVVDGKLVPIPASTDRFVIFRVVEARPAEAPAGLEEVREDLERDLRLARAFSAVKPVAEELFVVAQRLGVEQALTLFDDLRVKHGVRKAYTPPAFARRVNLSKLGDRNRYMEVLLADKPTLVAPSITGVGVSEEFVDECFEMTAEGWRPPALEAPPSTERTQAATTRPAAIPEAVVRLLAMPDLHRWFIIELLGVDVVDQNRYETELKGMAYGALLSERRKVLQAEWFELQNIEKRCAFSMLRDESQGGTEEGIARPSIPPPPPPPEMPEF